MREEADTALFDLWLRSDLLARYGSATPDALPAEIADLVAMVPDAVWGTTESVTRSGGRQLRR